MRLWIRYCIAHFSYPIFTVEFYNTEDLFLIFTYLEEQIYLFNNKQKYPNIISDINFS